MKKINWDEQPTPEHLAAVYLDSRLNCVEWVLPDDGGFGNDDKYFYSSDIGQRVDIVKRQETEPYKPEVGEWCECSYSGDSWSKVYYIGTNSTGVPIIELTTAECFPAGELAQFRPIKSEREKFIEKFHGMDAGQMYDNGARFTDEN